MDVDSVRPASLLDTMQPPSTHKLKVATWLLQTRASIYITFLAKSDFCGVILNQWDGHKSGLGGWSVVIEIRHPYLANELLCFPDYLPLVY